MVTRRSHLREIVATALPVGLAACGLPGQAGPSTPQLAPVTLEFQHHYGAGGPGDMGWNAVVDKFRGTYPQVTFNRVKYAAFDQIVTASVAGLPPHLMDIYGSGSLYPSSAARGMLLKLDDHLKGSRTVTRNSFLPALQDLMALDSGTYALPVEAGAVLLFYNADLLRELGLPLPQESWRWSGEFLDAARQVTRVSGPAETQRFGAETVTKGYWGGAWWVHLWAEGGDLLTKDNRRSALLDGTGIDGVQFAADLTNRFRVTPTPEARATGPTAGANAVFFESGRQAFFPQAHFQYITIKQRSQFKWGVAPLPQGKGGAKTWSNAWPTGIGAGTQNQDAAWAFLEFSLRPENYAEFLRFVSWMPPIKMPTRPPLIENPQDWAVMSDWVAKNGRPLPAISQIDEVLRVANAAIRPVLDAGVKPAREAAQEASPQINAVLG